MAEIARALSYPNNSVFRIVSTLEERGYLVKNADSGHYRLTRKLLALGYQGLDETSLTEKSVDILRSLRDESGETALIGILLDGEGVVLDLALSHETVKFMVSPGTRFYLHTAAPGKAILAGMEESERERQISLIKFVRFNERTILSAGAYRAELEKTRLQGYGVDNGEQVDGIICVAAPVLDYRMRPAAAVWVTGPESRLRDIPRAAETVMSHAKKISARLGRPL
jgi:DNA-binding IclR family transcriptional regulator